MPDAWSGADERDLDDEPPWIVLGEDDEFTIAVPAERLALIVARLEQAADAFSTELTVEVDSPTGRRLLERTEIARLIDDASSTCLDIVRRSPATLDYLELVDLTQSSELLTTIWSLSLQADDPDGADLERELAWVAAIGKLAADCEDMFLTRIRPRDDGTFTLRWSLVDRALVREAIAELRSLMSSDDPAISRLFPSAYGSDAERNAGWDVLMRGELIDKRLAALQVTEELMTRRSCTQDELNAFMRCLNDARLVLGTQLDVDESGFPADPDGATRTDRIVYESLTHLLGRTVEALSGGL